MSRPATPPVEAPYAYVKKFYGVNPVIGSRVQVAGDADNPRQGVIVRKRSYDHYVHVKFDGHNFDVPVHPFDLLYEAPDNPPGLTMPKQDAAV